MIKLKQMLQKCLVSLFIYFGAASGKWQLASNMACPL